MLATTLTVVARPCNGKGKEARSHVNYLYVHIVACVGVLGGVDEVAYIQSVLPDRMLDTSIFDVILHVGVKGVDDGCDRVIWGVLLLPNVDDLVFRLDVDKLLVGDTQITEHH